MKRGGTIDMTGIANVISKMPTFRKMAKIQAQNRVAQEKQAFIDEFSTHKVTQEIEEGVRASNISNTLGGAGTNANLYTFIGFGEGFNPVRPIKTILQTSIQVSSVSSRVQGGASQRPIVDVNVQLPNENTIREATYMPWEPGKSWVTGIEEGISGFGYYMYKKFEGGRSQFGLQSKYKVRNSSFRPVPYFKEMLARFINRLQRL